jgi:cholinesterase
VNGFIAESGTATSFSLNPPPTNNLAAWFNASAALGCGGPAVGIASSVACVRTKPFQALLAVTRVANPLAAVTGNFGPTSDGKVVFSDYTRRGERGDFVRKPFFTGSNFNEAGLFKILAAAGNFSLTETQWALFNLHDFQCPAAMAARYRFRADVPVWRYLYFGDFPNLVLTNNPPSGAWHGSEIPIVWKTSVDASGLPNTPAENSISTYLNKAWAAFAKDPYDAFDRAPYHFPEYDPGGKQEHIPFSHMHQGESSPERSLLLLALHNRTHPVLSYPHSFDAVCPLIDYLSATLPGGLNALILTPTGFGLRDFAALAARAPPHLVAGNATRLLEEYIRQIRNPNLVAAREDLKEPTEPWPHKAHQKVGGVEPVGSKVAAWDTWDTSEAVLKPA